MRSILLALFFALTTSTVLAEIKNETVDYKDKKTQFEGFISYDSSFGAKKRPAVLIIHQWKGLSDYEKMRAIQLAEKGYIAFAADIYGKGIRPEDTADASRVSSGFKENRKLYRERLKTAYDWLKKNKMVDSQKIVVIGYCFGGTGALELARAGEPLAGAVSFHGGLSTSQPQDAKNIKAKLLVLHGAIDPYVPQTEVDTFFAEMNNAKIDYQFIAYSGAVHSFTMKSAGHDLKTGQAYNEVADRRSWQAFMNFLAEVAPTQ